MNVKSMALAFFVVVKAFASYQPTEVVDLPTSTNLGFGDKIGSNLIYATYNAGEGPGIWIVADGGFRLYHNGSLLIEENQAGRVRFVPMTFLPGENAISVVSVNGKGAPGILVQIDDLDKSYYSDGSWKSKTAVSNTAWKNKGRNLSQWGNATTLSYSNTLMPSGGVLNGFASNTEAKWIWSGSESDETAILLFTFYVKAEGFGQNTTGGDAGNIVIASDTSSIRKYMQSSDAMTILVPEGTYDFRKFVDAATSAANSGYTWCKSSCGNTVNSSNTFYRISFTKNSCSGLSESTTIVPTGEIQAWGNWMTVKANKSLIGMGRGANMRGASFANRSYEGAYNNIYRNLALYDVNPHLIEGGDGLEVTGQGGKEVENMWFDHISYKWISDGLDMEYVKGATISYLDYDGSNEYNCYYYDPYMHLVETAELTFANNYWHSSFGRVPKVTSESNGSYASKVHIYNSFVDYNHWHVIDASGKSNFNTQILYENNYIKDPQIQVAGKDAYSSINFKNTTVTNAKSKTPYNNNNTSQAAAFTDNVFTPSYSYVLRTNANIPTEIPKLAGVGGRFGQMPSYNQAFGLSNKAPTVSILTPTVNSQFDKDNSITFTASAIDSDGSVKYVDFYVDNTKIGSATASPYSVTASGFEPGVYSVVAVATDNSGLSQMSEFVTIEVTGETIATLKKCGAGSSSQTINLGEEIVSFCYTFTGANKIAYSNFPEGITVSVDYDNGIINISGTPLEVGDFNYIVQTVGSTKDTVIDVRHIIVLDTNASALESSSSYNTPNSSNSVTTGLKNLKLKHNGAHFFKIFDLQGQELFHGEKRPDVLPADRAIVIEYDVNGFILNKRIERKF